MADVEKLSNEVLTTGALAFEEAIVKRGVIADEIIHNIPLSVVLRELATRLLAALERERLDVAALTAAERQTADWRVHVEDRLAGREIGCGCTQWTEACESDDHMFARFTSRAESRLDEILAYLRERCEKTCAEERKYGDRNGHVPNCPVADLELEKP